MSAYKAYIFKRNKIGDREEVRIKVFDSENTPIDLGGSGGLPEGGEVGDVLTNTAPNEGEWAPPKGLALSVAYNGNIPTSSGEYMELQPNSDQLFGTADPTFRPTTEDEDLGGASAIDGSIVIPPGFFALHLTIHPVYVPLATAALDIGFVVELTVQGGLDANENLENEHFLNSRPFKAFNDTDMQILSADLSAWIWVDPEYEGGLSAISPPRLRRAFGSGNAITDIDATLSIFRLGDYIRPDFEF